MLPTFICWSLFTCRSNIHKILIRTKTGTRMLNHHRNVEPPENALPITTIKLRSAPTMFRGHRPCIESQRGKKTKAGRKPISSTPLLITLSGWNPPPSDPGKIPRFYLVCTSCRFLSNRLVKTHAITHHMAVWSEESKSSRAEAKWATLVTILLGYC